MTNSDWPSQINTLLYRIQRQDKLALREFYELVATKLLALIQRIVGDQSEAEDILQEVILKIWQQSDKYTGSGSAWGWVCVLARNASLDRLRSAKRRPNDSLDESPELLEKLSETHDLSDNHWLGQCLVKLKPQVQEAIVLSYVNGYSHGELSEKLSLPLGTVKAWIRRGLQELKQCLAA